MERIPTSGQRYSGAVRHACGSYKPDPYSSSGIRGTPGLVVAAVPGDFERASHAAPASRLPAAGNPGRDEGEGSCCQRQGQDLLSHAGILPRDGTRLQKLSTGAGELTDG